MLDDLLDRMEELLVQVESLDEPVQSVVQEIIGGIEQLHGLALRHLPDALSPAEIERARAAHPALRWLFEVYQVGVDERMAADRALDPVRGYVDSQGGRLELLDARDGVVRIRLSGSCSGCRASAATLREGVEAALRDGLPGFVALETDELDGAPSPPPGTPLQIRRRSRFA